MNADEERRSMPRIPLLAGARISFCDGAAIKCRVRNLSRTGAKLELPDVIALPANFELTIDQTEETYMCRTLWREGGCLGVTFVCEPEIRPPPLALQRQPLGKAPREDLTLLRLKLAQLKALLRSGG